MEIEGCKAAMESKYAEEPSSPIPQTIVAVPLSTETTTIFLNGLKKLARRRMVLILTSHQHRLASLLSIAQMIS